MLFSRLESASESILHNHKKKISHKLKVKYNTMIRGPCTIDLFADRLNCQLPRFCSWKPDPMALATDAFQQNWSAERNYAFPPFCLIMSSLAKLRAEGGELILVTPVWPSQALYPSICTCQLPHHCFSRGPPNFFAVLKGNHTL